MSDEILDMNKGETIHEVKLERNKVVLTGWFAWGLYINIALYLIHKILDLGIYIVSIW